MLLFRRSTLPVSLMLIATWLFVLSLPLSSEPALAGAPSSQPSSIQDAFQGAANEFNVPLPVLMAVGYVESRWGQAGSSASADIMGLGTSSNLGQFSPLNRAARMLNLDPSDIEHNPVDNIRAGAALLASYQQDLHGTTPANPSLWYGAVAAYSGSRDYKTATSFAGQVYQVIKAGQALATSAGQTITLQPQDIQPDRTTLQGLQLHGTPNQPGPDCPSGLQCTFLPALYKHYSRSAANFGNYDLANRPADGLDIRYIVIHDTEGSAKSAINEFRRRSYVSANYVVGQDGSVTEMVRPGNVAWHAGNWYVNAHAIGIEHAGLATRGNKDYTPEMYLATARLVAYLAKRYNIPLDRQHIFAHSEVPGVSAAGQTRQHWDPGPSWNWSFFFNLLGSPLAPTHPASNSQVLEMTPRFDLNVQPMTHRGRQLSPRLTNFIYLHTAPRSDAPLISDLALHRDYNSGSQAINDWGDKAVTGRRYVRAGQKGNWTAIYYGGRKAWFWNPFNENTTPVKATVIEPKAGMNSIPVYGAAYPGQAAYAHTAVPLSQERGMTPLQYTIPAGQRYTATGPFKADFYHTEVYDQPALYRDVKGNTLYYQISFGHRFAFVKASDVQVVSDAGK